MQFDIAKSFRRALAAGIFQARGLEDTRKIKVAEGQKIVFLDQASENPYYCRFICHQVNLYTVCLEALYNRIAPQEQRKPDEQLYGTDQVAVYHTMQLLLQLRQLVTRRQPGLQAGQNQIQAGAHRNSWRFFCLGY